MDGTISGPENNIVEESSNSHSTTDPKEDQTKNPESDSINKKVTEPVSVKKIKMSSNLLEPPTFISEDKPFEVYKKDLQRWS